MLHVQSLSLDKPEHAAFLSVDPPQPPAELPSHRIGNITVRMWFMEVNAVISTQITTRRELPGTALKFLRRKA
jgi:hypothetical protein